MNRRSYGYLVRALNEFASVMAQCGSKDAPPSDSGTSSNPNGRPIEGILVYGAAARPESRLRRSRTISFVIFEKSSNDNVQSWKKRPHKPRFFLMFAGVLLARFFFSLRDPFRNSKPREWDVDPTAPNRC